MGHYYAEEDLERRLRTEPEKHAGRGCSESDWRLGFRHDLDRVLHSGAFRRLQGKTQVVDPWEGDFFRTRLTHSLECAQIGRALASRTGANEDLLQAVCLSHDIGNPPFGHNGEAELERLMGRSGGFEGNAQGFRVLTRLETKFGNVRQDKVYRRYGLNLTRAVLASSLKYPWRRGEGAPPEFGKGAGDKYNYYRADSEAFDFATEGLPARHRRFEGSLAEWADDTAYAVHDLEDGIRAHFINLHSLKKSDSEQKSVAERTRRILQKARPTSIPDSDLPDMLRDFLNEDFFTWANSSFVGNERQKAQVKLMTSSLIQYFILSVPVRDDFDPANDSADVPDEAYVKNRMLYAITYEYTIRRRELSTIQRGQKRIVQGLFESLMSCPHDELSDMLPDPIGTHLRTHPHRLPVRRRCICDHIAGMTDRYAVRLYDRLVLARGSVKDVL